MSERAPEQVAVSIAQPLPRPATGVAILHVDDSPADRYRRRRVLEGAGFRVIDADSGLAAREAFTVEHADLVLLDVRLPDTTGFALARQIKADAAAAERDVAIVLVSAYFTEPEYRVRGFESGADAYLIEPVEDAELIATVLAIELRLEQLKAARANERLLRGATEQLQRADDAKNDLLATVVHEIRQPIQTALAAVSVIRSATDPRTATWAQDMVERMLIQIARITSDLLDVTHMDHGELALQLEPHDLCTVLRRSLETVRSVRSEHGPAITTSLPDAPVMVEADAARLEQVFVNLLSNAIRYTPDGGRVDVSLDLAPAEARVIIADTGEGIRAEDLSRIFNPFVRASSRPGGLGVGLAVARSLVASHGGTLAAQSDGPGKGSTFTVTLARK